jgi:trans-aconitate 2-methyltransferase
MIDQHWNTALYENQHSFVYEYGSQLLDLLQPKVGERILDLGCGTGHLTRQICNSGAAVIGIDNSPEMIETAKSNYPEIDFQIQDARELRFDVPFNAVFSNAVLHWIPEPLKVAECISASLATGGRFVAEFGGKGNNRSIMNALQQSKLQITGKPISSHWYFPTIGEYGTILEKVGLEVQNAWHFDRPTKLEDGERGLHHWIEMFCSYLLEDISLVEKEQVIAKTEEICRPVLFKEGSWVADYRRLRVVAFKI